MYDPDTGLLYVVANTLESGENIYRMYTINPSTHTVVNKGAPIAFEYTMPNGYVFPFVAAWEHTRVGLIIWPGNGVVNKMIITSWGSHCAHRGPGLASVRASPAPACPSSHRLASVCS